MKIITPKRIITFLKAPTGQKNMFREAFLLLFLARVSVLFVPFRVIAKKMGERMLETLHTTDEANYNTLLEISKSS